MRLDLGARRGAGELLATTVAVFRAHASLFFTMTLLLVAPVTIAVSGIWGRALADGPGAAGPPAAALTQVVVQALLVTPVVAALHIVCLLAMSRGEQPGLRAAFRAAAPALAPAIGAAALAGLATAVGFVLLIVPGVWLLVRLYLSAQAAVAEGLAPRAAVRRSAELVAGAWWPTLGRLLLAGLAIGSVIVVGQVLGAQLGSNPLYVSVVVVTQAAGGSLIAIFAALLFFELRARKEGQTA